MPHQLRQKPAFVIVGLWLLCLGGSIIAPSCNTHDDTLLVFAAASLSDYLNPVGEAFTRDTGVPVRFSFGGSYLLSRQIARGAPADLFIPAGTTPLRSLADGDLLLPDTITTVLRNELVLVGSGKVNSSDNIRQILSEHVSRLAIANPQLAPAGEYAQTALEQLGLWQTIQAKLVFAPDVRSALAYLERGDVDAALVYKTDAGQRKKLGVIAPFPVKSHHSIIYPGVIIRQSRNLESAKAFLHYLNTQPVQAIFQQQGWDIRKEDSNDELAQK